MVRIGVSGWRYKAWRRDYYPEGLVQRRELAWLSRRLGTVELNGSFYSLQRASSYRGWRSETPRGFRFAVKGSRFITHNLKLGNARGALANFMASGLLAMGEKLGPLLWQLPAQQRFRPDRLDAFCALLPRDTRSAVALATEHDDRVPDPCLEAGARRRLRHALEVRHESFFCEEAIGILRRHGISLVVSDAPDWPRIEEITAGFVYVRLHGHTSLYRSRYSDDELDEWAVRIEAWARGPRAGRRDVYVYFDNDALGHAPWDAERLQVRMKSNISPDLQPL